jgi:hypothetical protein
MWRDGALFTSEGCRALLTGDSAENTLTLSATGSAESARQLISLFRTHLDGLQEQLPNLTVNRRVVLPPDFTVSENFDHLLTLERMGVRRFVPEGTGQTYDVTATLDRVIAPQVRFHGNISADVHDSATIASAPTQEKTWETESADRQLVRMRRVRGLVEKYARSQTRNHFLRLGAGWLIFYLVLLQLSFLGAGQHIIAALVAFILYARQARQVKSWLPQTIYTRVVARHRFETLVEIDFDEAAYRQLEDEHGFHDTFL